MSLKRVLAILFALFALGAIGIAIGLAVFLPRYVRNEVIEQAKRRGIELEPGEVSFGLGWVQVKDAQLSLVGVPNIRAHAGIIDVELARFVPLRFTLNQVKVTASGSAATVEANLTTWMRAHEAQFTEPVFMKPVDVEYRQHEKGDVSITLNEAEVSADKERLKLVAKRATAEQHELGAVRLNAKKDYAELAFTLGLSELANPTLTFEAQRGEHWKFHVALAPVLVSRLASALKTELPFENVTASGTFDLDLPRAMSPVSHPTGRADATLKGYVPPHPAELDGFVFGDTTTLGTRYTVIPEQLKVLLEDTHVKAGAFELKGSGTVGVETGTPRVRLNLSGALPCAALAGAAAQTRLGTALARVSAKAARTTLEGAVGVKVVVDAELMNLDKPRVLKTIVPGCGLKQLTLGELRALGELLPEALDPAVASDLANLLKSPLPALPQLDKDTTIDLSKLKTLPLPTLPLPAPPAAKPSTPRAPASGR